MSLSLVRSSPSPPEEKTVMSDYDENIEAQLIDLAEADNLHELGVLMAKLFAAKVALTTESVRVICTANDIRPYGELFFEELDQLTEGEVSLSCYWNDFIPAPERKDNWGEKLLRDLSSVTHQFHDEKGVRVDHIVTLSSNLAEGSTIAENLLRTQDIVDACSATVISPIATHEELSALLDHFQVREANREHPQVLLGLRPGHPRVEGLMSLRHSSNDQPARGDTDIPEFVTRKMAAKAERRFGR